MSWTPRALRRKLRGPIRWLPCRPRNRRQVHLPRTRRATWQCAGGETVSLLVSGCRHSLEHDGEQIRSVVHLVGRVPMPTRSEILNTLAASQEQVMTYFQGLSPEVLERSCTASGV